jgi:hypothetical protein
MMNCQFPSMKRDLRAGLRISNVTDCGVSSGFCAGAIDTTGHSGRILTSASMVLNRAPQIARRTVTALASLLGQRAIDQRYARDTHWISCLVGFAITH